MRKIKVLISVFVMMLILSMDLGSIFSDTAEKPEQTVAEQESAVFEIANLQHNLGCITNAMKKAVSSKVSGAAEGVADKYANAVADTTTKTVENAIAEKTKK